MERTKRPRINHELSNLLLCGQIKRDRRQMDVDFYIFYPKGACFKWEKKLKSNYTVCVYVSVCAWERGFVQSVHVFSVCVYVCAHDFYTGN